ncbi:hypothetical protein BDZ97DRAFT_1797613 [Flammula alnicola]|nr:hypothetical protein BDZ97DRAFT_1797613 [Flammula alnicola]
MSASTARQTLPLLLFLSKTLPLPCSLCLLDAGHFFPAFSPVQHGKFALGSHQLLLPAQWRFSSITTPEGISIHMHHVFLVHLLTCPGGCRPTRFNRSVQRLRPEPGGRGRVAPNLHSISGLPTPQVSPWPRVTRSVMPSIITKPLHRVYSLSIMCVVSAPSLLSSLPDPTSPYLVRIPASRTCPPNSRPHQKSTR